MICIVPIVLISISLGANYLYSVQKLKPEITYAEFPIKLIYEINGQQKVVEDTLVCEYDGISHGIFSNANQTATGYGYRRNWKSYLLSNKEEIRDESYIPVLEVSVVDTLCFFVGNPSFYMGDSNSEESYAKFRVMDIEMSGKGFRGWLGSNIEEKYGVKLIKFEHPNPIKNKFADDK